MSNFSNVCLSLSVVVVVIFLHVMFCLDAEIAKNDDKQFSHLLFHSRVWLILYSFKSKIFDPRFFLPPSIDFIVKIKFKCIILIASRSISNSIFLSFLGKASSYLLKFIWLYFTYFSILLYFTYFLSYSILHIFYLTLFYIFFILLYILLILLYFTQFSRSRNDAINFYYVSSE